MSSVTFAGLSLEKPRIFGIINVTPDSFSDGGDALALVAVEVVQVGLGDFTGALALHVLDLVVADVPFTVDNNSAKERFDLFVRKARQGAALLAPFRFSVGYLDPA